jgi:hypothetical protein
MSHSIFHAQSSVRRFGGKVEDYLALHDWLDVIWTVKSDHIHHSKFTSNRTTKQEVL